jgi:hypothetical protein
MRKIALCSLLLSGAVVTLGARPAGVEGTYVEARTAEVFAGGCVMNGEAGTAGREALLAWKVDHGTVNGVNLDGLAVVAAVAADVNLGVHEIGGENPNTRAALFVDQRATDAQKQALVSMVKSLSGSMVGTVVEVTSTPIEFSTGAHDIQVATQTVKLTVHKHLNHDASCGNKQWFGPLSTVAHAEMGTTAENAFSGAALGTKWSDPDKRSSFFGTFAY